jgi:chorismate-pyruvate lyase
MPKAEISWKRVTEDGAKLQVNAQRVGGEWIFSQREKRFDQWKPVKEPPLEDWLALLDSVQRMITRRRLQPVHEELVLRRIRERFPEAKV